MNSDQWRYPRGVIDPPGPIVLPGAPLQLYERGIWNPAAQYWGEPEDTIAASIAHQLSPLSARCSHARVGARSGRLKRDRMR